MEKKEEQRNIFASEKKIYLGYSRQTFKGFMGYIISSSIFKKRDKEHAKKTINNQPCINF